MSFFEIDKSTMAYKIIFRVAMPFPSSLQDENLNEYVSTVVDKVKNDYTEYGKFVFHGKTLEIAWDQEKTPQEKTPEEKTPQGQPPPAPRRAAPVDNLSTTLARTSI